MSFFKQFDNLSDDPVMFVLTMFMTFVFLYCFVMVVGCIDRTYNSQAVFIEFCKKSCKTEMQSVDSKNFTCVCK